MQAGLKRESLRQLFKRGRIYFRDEGELDTGAFDAYGTDRTKRFSADFSVLAFPGDTHETADLVRYAYENELPLVPSGGRTGLAGGAVASRGEIVVSMERMARLIDFDPFLPSLTVEAGMITAVVQKEAESRDLYFPVDFAAAGSAMIGGNLATNAGGVHVVRYGMIRQWVLALTVVTGAGEILKTGGKLLKNNTGFDLRNLFIGSEGTLGIITEAVLRLAAPPGPTELFLIALDDFKPATELFQSCRASGHLIHMFEYFDRRCLEIVRNHLDLPAPFKAEYRYFVLVEYEHPGEANGPPRFLTEALEEGSIQDAVRAESSAAEQRFRKYREGISESLSMMHTVHKNDVSLPVGRMVEFLVTVHALLGEQGSGIKLAVFGHLGDGNLHLNLIKPGSLSTKSFFEICDSLDRDVYASLADVGGSVSAEHGIGLLKKEYLGFSRSAAEIRIMRQVKSILDPKGIMNPGKLFPD